MNIMEMKRLLIFFTCLLLILSVLSCTKNGASATKQDGNLPSKLSIIPLPEIINYSEKVIELPSKITISSSFDDTMQELLKKTFNSVLSLSTDVQDNASSYISVKEDASLGKEEYLLEITDKGIIIYYSAKEGLIWGVQSLRQILEQTNFYNSDSKKYALIVSVKDKPKYAWRGFHIDLARHMFTLNFLKKTIDYLSLYKINKLHLHLTDDQGWRIEIKKYSKLTEIGAWRKFDRYDKECLERAKTDNSFDIDKRFIRNGDEYGGFYTQNEMKELVDYARKRGIDIIPEIDMPGHMTAAIRAYNDMSCTGNIGWGDEFSDPLCSGKEKNYTMIKEIIDELYNVFPSDCFHMGADEVSVEKWEKCEKCQKVMKEKNFTDISQLKSYFVDNISSYLKQKGKKVLVWDDAFDESLPKDITYFFWRDWVKDNPGIITQSGAKMIFMDWESFYLSADVSDKSISTLYNYNINSRYLNVVETNLLGYQACVFTEHIPNEIIFEEHVYPSLQAFSEVAWGSKRDYSHFANRMKWHIDMMTKNNIHYTKCSF